jgi:N-acetylglucosaminyl-diphospho-decaprenol L-rhamnosyltransferase
MARYCILRHDYSIDGTCLVSAPIHLSIVSHLQAVLVSDLLADLARIAPADLKITVLSNVPENPPTIPGALAGRLEHLVNETPAGFGANHNAVFRRCIAPYFCVLNPDLRLPKDPFPELLRAFSDERVALAAPAASDSKGVLQDSARRLPTPWKVASKIWSRSAGPDYSIDRGIVYPDWVAGFFMLLRSSAFRDLGGFDENYFLYYEDIDLCSRLRLAGWKNAWVPTVKIVHQAQRRSHRDASHLSWHLASIARFFSSPVYRKVRQLPASNRER